MKYIVEGLQWLAQNPVPIVIVPMASPIPPTVSPEAPTVVDSVVAAKTGFDDLADTKEA